MGLTLFGLSRWWSVKAGFILFGNEPSLGQKISDPAPASKISGGFWY